MENQENGKVNLVRRMFLDIYRDTGVAPDPELVEKVVRSNTLGSLRETYQLIQDATTLGISLVYEDERTMRFGYRTYCPSLTLNEDGRIMTVNLSNRDKKDRIVIR